MKSGLSTADADSITIAGFDLASELMGEVGLAEMTFLMVMGEKPTPQQATMLNAVLVGLCDHGLTPTAIAARMTLLSAPDSFQGAMAAGILGAGSRFLGVVEDAARVLQAAIARREPAQSDAELARAVLVEAQERGEKVPGLGHHLHKDGDPRVARLAQLASDLDVECPHLSLLLAIGEEWNASSTTHLPVNGAGASGAVLSDLGMPAEIVRGFAIVSRAAGTLAQLAEEMRDPIARELWNDAERSIEYSPRGRRT